jgi:hypothetical protein
MSVGESGRIVVELPPQMKRELHAALSHDGLTLKAWLVLRAEDYLRNRSQMSMFDGATEGGFEKRTMDLKGKYDE